MTPIHHSVRSPGRVSKVRGGFTLIEVLVAMGVLAFGVLGFAAMRTKSLNNASTATDYAQAISIAAGKLDFCRSMSNYLMMACTPGGLTAGKLSNPILDGSCPVPTSTMTHFCAGFETHIESLPDSMKDDTLELHEKNYYNFRRRTLISPAENNVVKNLARIDVDVCWDKPGKAGFCYDPETPPDDGLAIDDPRRHCVDEKGVPWPKYAGNASDPGSCWCNSRVAYCVHLNMLRASR